MITNTKNWREYLGAPGSSPIRCVLTETFNPGAIKEAASQLNFHVFEMNLKYIASVDALMDSFAATMDFPPYFGRNWMPLMTS